MTQSSQLILNILCTTSRFFLSLPLHVAVAPCLLPSIPPQCQCRQHFFLIVLSGLSFQFCLQPSFHKTLVSELCLPLCLSIKAFIACLSSQNSGFFSDFIIIHFIDSSRIFLVCQITQEETGRSATFAPLLNVRGQIS